MRRLFLIFSHKLTEEQIADSKHILKVSKCIYMPEAIQKNWSNVDPEGDLDKTVLNKICNWLNDQAETKDFVLIQGEFGATYYLVDFCFKNGFIPIYATTKRVSEEKQNSDGTVERKQMFKHVGFRKYERM